MLTPQEVRDTPITQLRHHPKNPRKGDVGAIAGSIRTNGFYGTIVAQQSTGFVLAGNHRLMAAKEEGLESLPVAWVDVDDAAALRILAADNRTSDLGAYDERLLADLLSEVSNGGGIEGTGYVEADLDRLIASLVPPEVEPATEADQGRLDEVEKCVCPECGHEFGPPKK